MRKGVPDPSGSMVIRALIVFNFCLCIVGSVSDNEENLRGGDQESRQVQRQAVQKVRIGTGDIFSASPMTSFDPDMDLQPITIIFYYYYYYYYNFFFFFFFFFWFLNIRR